MKRIFTTACLCLMALYAISQPQRNMMRATDPKFFQTDEARRIGDQILLYQRVTGGWPKNIDMARELNEGERAKVLADKSRRDDSTTDNNATSMQMKYLARLYQATKDKRYKEGFNKAVEYLLSGQYESGGWPQFWPEMHGYQVHITYNDDAMVNTMLLLRDIAQQKSPYEGKLTDKALRKRAVQAFDKGVECILATQIRVDGKPTVWCQQHDRETFLPAKARAYELPSYCSQESASIVKLLMELPHPDERVKEAIHGAMKWFDKYKLTGLRLVRTGFWGGPDRDTQLVEDPQGKPLWARYYDLKYVEPYVCDRDGLPRRHLSDIGPERRNGYSWYGDRPAELYRLYDAWADKYDPTHKVNISLQTKGANENGLIQMFREPKKDMSDFDAIVNPNESIQAAIEQAPESPETPYKIFIRKGTYNQKVIIDRPNIVLVGEQR
ncbi:MAG: pectate lyase, partial [Prevotella sp.]|nr:pectate lyase [Prevotella sp.]